MKFYEFITYILALGKTQHLSTFKKPFQLKGSPPPVITFRYQWPPPAPAPQHRTAASTPCSLFRLQHALRAAAFAEASRFIHSVAIVLEFRAAETKGAKKDATFFRKKGPSTPMKTVLNLKMMGLSKKNIVFLMLFFHVTSNFLGSTGRSYWGLGN